MSHFPPKEFYRWQYHHHAYRRFGFFRRFFWFGLGAGVMAFWGHRRQEIENGNGNGARHGQEWRRWCRERHSIQQQQQQIDAAAATAAPNWEYPGGGPVNPAAAYNQPPAPTAPAPAPHCPLQKMRAQANVNTNANVDPQNPPTGMQQNFSPENFGPSFASFERSQQEFRAHQQAIEARVNELMKQTSDTMSKVSENAVDSLLASVQELKNKLAESREARERQKIRIEQTLPPRADDSQSVDDTRLV